MLLTGGRDMGWHCPIILAKIHANIIWIINQLPNVSRQWKLHISANSRFKKMTK